MQTIAAQEFSIRSMPRGEAQRLWLELFPLLAGPVVIPALVAHGREDGPTLLAVAGVHGNEYEGMEALRQVFANLDPATMRGTFVGLPIANPLAYEARTRETPPHLDGQNLARIFPGSATGSPSHILAHVLLQLVTSILTEDDIFIDLHSGSADLEFVQLIGFREVPGPARERAEAAARHFGFSRLWRIANQTGRFNAETARRCITTLGTETTGRAGCDAADVAAFAHGLENLLAYLGIRSDLPRPARFDGPAQQTFDVLAPATGFMRRLHGCNDDVAADELLARVVDSFGDPVAEIRAPRAGTIWAARSMPPVRVGELTFVIAER